MKGFIIRSIQMGMSFIIAVFITQSLGFASAFSAGAIAVLNLGNSKRQSLKLAWRRLHSTVLGLVILALMFYFLGYNLYTLGLFVIVFSPIAMRFNAQEGIIVNMVLGTHFIAANTVTTKLMLNELSLVLIGGFVAFIIHFIRPVSNNDLEMLSSEIDEAFKRIFVSMSYSLRNLCIVEERQSIEDLEKLLLLAKDKAWKYKNDFYFSDEQYYYDFFIMRYEQAKQMAYMEDHLSTVFIDQGDAIELSEFTSLIGRDFSHNNDGAKLLEGIDDIKKKFAMMPVPENHEVFESRAKLYQYLHDLESVIQLKNDFVKKYGEIDIKRKRRLL